MSDDLPDTIKLPELGDDFNTEVERVEALEAYEILDTENEEVFDRITSLVTKIFGTPMAMINFIDETRQWTKSCVGIEGVTSDRELSFCEHTIRASGALVVLDAREDERFVDNPAVESEPFLRFYAGAPLITPGGHAIGALCTGAYEPREEFGPREHEILQDLASLVVDELELRRETRERKREVQRRREITARMERNADRLQMALGAATMAVWEWETMTDQVQLVSELSPRYGFDTGEIQVTLEQLIQTVVADDRDAVLEQYEQARDEETLPPTRFRMRQTTDEIAWLEVVGRRRSPESSVFVGAVQDVTSEQNQLEEIRRSESNLKRVLDRLPLAVAAIHGTDVIYANAATEELLGIDASDVPFDAEALVHPDSRENVMRRIAEATQNPEGEPLEISENKAMRSDGEVRHVKSTAFTAKLMGKDVIISVMRDITEEKRILARMMQMDRVAAIGTLSSGVGHEINNPLSYIRGNLDYCIRWLDDLLQRAERGELEDIDVDDARDVYEALDEAREGTHRIREITRDLRRLASEPDEQFSLFPTNVNDVLTSATKLAYHEIKREARLETDLGDLPDAMAEPSSLGQTFLNILLNAARAFDDVSGGDNVVRVTSEERDDQIVVEIEDNGCGIPKDRLDSVFDPFYTTRTTGEGTGLGLTTAQANLERMNGHIEIESAEGEGTLVRIYVPKAPANPLYGPE